MYKIKSLFVLTAGGVLSIAAGAQSGVVVGPVPAPAGAPLSSSFAGPLWDVVAPNGGSASASNEHLYLIVPGGSNHDTLLPSNQALRVLQPIGDQDFDVSIKIDTPVKATDEDTGRGLMVVIDSQDFITLALVTDGTNLGLRGQSVAGSEATTVFNITSFNEYRNPMYLRMTRSGAAYTAYYSDDGVVWSQAATFKDARVPTSIGPFASNYNGNPARAVPVTMAINWFNVL
jgi:regulation of enolase protein 1 (concanavalin A-like superfamily)